MKSVDMNKILTILLGIFFGTTICAQTTIILQPDGSVGKDAFIDSRASDTNYGSHVDLPAIAWTNGGNPTVVRGLLNFDISSIPAGATIIDAKLSLFSYNSPANGSHSTESGSNASILSRITSTWKENTVTWDNQPGITTQNQVVLPASTSPIQHYLNIDVTNMTQDMIDDPDNSYGFQLKLATEQYYRSMIFASSDNSNATLHPKLEVTYTTDDCITLRPSSSQGKDAFIDNRVPDTNYGNHIDLASIAWTNAGSPTVVRGLIDFDFSSIPAGAEISSASLSLYSYNSPANGMHSTQSGSNASALSRITASWIENTVTWNNQPTTTALNQVMLPGSTNAIQNYTNIDVTDLVKDMVADPNNSYGFQLKLATEQYYRSMIFASSDNTDADLHPKLDICYSIPNAIIDNEDKNITFSVYPNPASKYLNIEVNPAYQKSVNIDIINATGQLIKRISDFRSPSSIDISDCAKGMYVVKVYFENVVAAKEVLFLR